jgi:hypothetical protein
VYAAISFFLGGLLSPFMAVKRSRGKKVLVVIRSTVQDYFRAGNIEEGFLVFKDLQKASRRIAMMPGVVSRKAGIYWVEVDDEKNCFYERKNGDAVATFDAPKYDSLLVRAIYKPGILGNDYILYILILVLLLFVVSIALAYMVFKQGKAIEAIQSAIVVVNNATSGQVL